MVETPRTVLFMPESAYGPTNNCIGIGDVLRRRGHRVVFSADASWTGRLSRHGFDEAPIDLAPPDGQSPQDPGQFWKDFIRDSAAEFRRPPIEQLENFMTATWRALIDGARYCEPQLKRILADVAPDVVVEDNVVCFPALVTADAPFVRIMSCNPLEVPGAPVPPAYSGLPSDDRSHWDEFRAEYRRTHGALWTDFNDWVQAAGAPPLPDLEFIHRSPLLNLYVFPETIDYTARRPLEASWHRLDSSVRETDAAFALPPELASRPSGSALVYVSLGSLGSADVGLMRRLVDVLAATGHRYIVSKGPRHNEYDLAPNMWGAEFLPQTRILPLVDLVITHGGNNTVTEALHFGKPMVVLPLFWDQHDNAQRLAETGCGIRLETYDFSAEDLRDAMGRLLADDRLRRRLEDAGEEIRRRDGVATAAALIEEAAAGGGHRHPL